MKGKDQNMKQIDDIEYSIVSTHDIFSSFYKEDFSELSHLFLRSSWSSGSTLFHRGGQGASMHFVAKGKVKLCIFSESGNELIFNILQPGESFGELALLGSINRMASAIALEDCEVLTINRNEWISIIENRPKTALHMLLIVSRKLRQATEFLEDLTFCDGSVRLARHFLRLADLKGRRTETGISINLSLSQQQIGDMVGLTRESINKYLVRWRSCGYLTWNKKRYTIIDMEKLAQVSAGKIN